MKAKLLTGGNDGSKHYDAGDTYEGDGEWIRKLLVNGLADPLDDEAKAIAESEFQQQRHGSAALKAAAAEIQASK